MAEPKSFLEILKWDNDQARAYLEAIRWPDGPACPDCGETEIYRITAKTRRNGKTQPTRHLLKCKGCQRQFSATVGTIFEDSKVPLSKWLAAIHLMCASKKGVSAHQIHRMLGVTYKTAWFMCHRVRFAMQDKDGALLSGTIEADETYVGGKPRGHRAHRSQRMDMSERIKAAWDKKTPVFGILERGGRVRAVAMDRMSKVETQAMLRENIDTQVSVLMTDESPLYTGMNRHILHRTVEHKREYVRGDGIHTQGIENFWSLLKRGLMGTYHHVTPEYLGCYVDEFAFKYNTRAMTDGERVASALQQAKGRLSWYVGRRASQAVESQPAS